MELSQSSAMRFIVFLGTVSLFADITYEGARGILGPYFAALGSSAAVVGIVAGAGELAGFALRLVSGYLADRTRAYWFLTIVGYSVNLLAMPLLALTRSWGWAAALVIAERTGKSIRTPARDVMLSHAAHRVGSGWGFGLHAAMDQVGAVLGPLLVASILAEYGSFPIAFGTLAIPAALAIVTLLLARRSYPDPRNLEPPAHGLETKGYPREFWLYVAAAGLLAMGYVDFPLIAYHLQKRAITGTSWIPVFYSFAMLVNGVSALGLGKLYDRIGILVMPLATLLSAAALPLAFGSDRTLVLAGIALWGLGMGAMDAVLRAGVAAMIPAERRGAAYGVYNAAFGIMWFIGSAVMGGLYDSSITALVIFGIAAQALSAALFLVYRAFAGPRRI